MSDELLLSLREVMREPIPLPAGGSTAERHRTLFELGRQDLSLSRLAEAHFDALAILAEAGRQPVPGAIYGVWAAEIPGQPVRMMQSGANHFLSGRKMFCSGATLIDRALVTVDAPDPWLVDLDLGGNVATMAADTSVWKVAAFCETKTATVDFNATPVEAGGILGERGWYLSRPGFWHGALGPAACWAGGAVGLVDYALKHTRSDPHTLAHLGAMEAAAWALQAVLGAAGNEADQNPNDVELAHKRALKCRHLIEQLATDILTRFGRAYGPFPLAFVEEIGTRHQELTIYLRQCHAERDLAALGQLCAANKAGA